MNRIILKNTLVNKSGSSQRNLSNSKCNIAAKKKKKITKLQKIFDIIVHFFNKHFIYDS